MGGPTSFVLLPEPLSSEQHKELLDLMAQLGEIEENFKSRSGTKTEHEADTYYLQIINSSAFGLNLPDIGGWPFIVSYERLPSWELKALKVVEQKISSTLVVAIHILIVCLVY
jgi:hypothetical protein